MNPDAKQKWVAALRSGEFEQCTGALEAPGRRLCCLGVACVVAEREGVKVKRQDGGDGKIAGRVLSANGQPAVMEWLGGISDHVEESLMYRNDSYRHSFNQIADYIQRHVR